MNVPIISSDGHIVEPPKLWEERLDRRFRDLARDPVLGAVVVMAADARRVCAALASAARGGLALEAYDAVA